MNAARRLVTNDISARIDELRGLKPGWLDGAGDAPGPEFLDWLNQQFEPRYPADVPLPCLYPTAEGGVQAEWSVGAHEISLEIASDTHQAEWQALNLETGDQAARRLDLDDPAGWAWVAGQIRTIARQGGEEGMLRRRPC
jgi:hypothetical protein